MSLRDKFTGTGIAIVTPFHEDGKIDWKSFSNLIQWAEEHMLAKVPNGSASDRKNRGAVAIDDRRRRSELENVFPPKLELYSFAAGKLLFCS